MNKKLFALIGGAALVLALMCFTLGSAEETSPLERVTAVFGGTPSPRAGQLNHAANSSSLAGSSPGIAQTASGSRHANSLSLLRQRLTQSTDLLKLRNELLNSPDFDAKDKAYYAAAIDEACYVAGIQEGWITPDPTLYVLQAPRVPNLDKGTENDPRLLQRKAAVTKLQAMDLRKACSGYRARPPSQADILENWKRGAAQGDARSAAMLSDLKLREKQVPIGNIQGAPLPPNLQGMQLTSPPDPSAEHIRLLQAALATGDPSALISLGPTLMQTYENGRFYFGQERETITRDLREALWPMLACDFGSNCGPDNSTLLRACARNGQCDIPDLETYYRSYVLSPAEIAQYDRLKPQLLDAIRTGNWSAIQFVSPRPTGGAPNYIQPIRLPAVLGRG